MHINLTVNGKWIYMMIIKIQKSRLYKREDISFKRA